MTNRGLQEQPDFELALISSSAIMLHLASGALQKDKHKLGALAKDDIDSAVTHLQTVIEELTKAFALGNENLDRTFNALDLCTLEGAVTLDDWSDDRKAQIAKIVKKLRRALDQGSSLVPGEKDRIAP